MNNRSRSEQLIVHAVSAVAATGVFRARDQMAFSGEEKSSKKENNKNTIPAVKLRIAGADRAWLVVKPQRGKERVLTSILRSKGIEFYMPVIAVQKMDRLIRKPIFVPEQMFTGYMLVRAAPGQAYQVFGLPYVMGVLPMALMDGVVRGIRSREKQGIIRQCEPPAQLKPGEKVSVRLNNYIEAIVSEPLDMKRVSLITGMFNGSARFVCGIEHVVRQCA